MNPPESSCLLIADISGYTSYLAGVELDHAQDILADLIGTVVTSLRPTFRLAKLEGDAAFTAAPADKVDGSTVLDTIERCYFGFRRRRRDVRQATSCECDACLRIPDLNLKFVVHQGLVVRQRMAGMEELVGRDVIVVHRHVEAYEHLGEVPAWIHDLERRWQDEESRQRVFLEPAKAWHAVSMPTTAPPQVAWEFLTRPGKRVAWSAGVTDVIVEAPGNRRGVGATNHCMHGKDAIIEEVLDWRPFDYLTIRSTMGTPAGPVKFMTTTELEPTAEGTTVHMRFGGFKTARERELMDSMWPMFEGLFAESGRALRELAADELEARADVAAIEPALPAPTSDGLFSEMTTLQPVG